jgi:hypothetical protein
MRLRYPSSLQASRGGGVPFVREETDQGRIVREVVDEISAAHPERPIRVDTRVEPRGWWDPAGLGQALRNLIGPAV